MHGIVFAARSIAALVYAFCASCVWAAPAALGFVAPDEEPRYSNMLLGLRQGLQAAGTDIKDLEIIEHRIERGDTAAASRAAGSLRAKRARLAFVVGTELTRSMRSAVKDLPIVFITPGDPVRAGLAASLSHPGNNLTGMTFEFPELSAKRVEMLKEINPAARRVGVVFDRSDGSPLRGYSMTKDAATKLGIQLVELDIETLRQDRNGAARKGKLDGVVVIPGGAVLTVTGAAIELAAKQRVATVVGTRNEATRDAILSYGINDIDVARNAARLVKKVLDGSPAGDLPIEQPTKFELIVNLKTAKSLGIKIPQSILVRADKVIE